MPRQTTADTASLPAPRGAGYFASWHYREPPRVSDPSNFSYATWTPVPYCIEGPGDVPLGFVAEQQPPTWAQGLYIYNGQALAYGNFVGQPLTFAPAYDNPLSHFYP